MKYKLIKNMSNTSSMDLILEELVSSSLDSQEASMN